MTLVKIKNNVHDILEKKQEEAIKKAAEYGILNPLEDEEHSKSFRLELPNGEPIVFFIDRFELLNYDDFTPNQVRKAEVSKPHCKETLIPRIKSDGGLKHAILVNSRYEIQHGHNRRYSYSVAYPGRGIPSFVMSDPYKALLDGSYEKVTENKEALARVSRIRPNPPKENLEYTMEDAAAELKNFYDDDNYCLGLNPTGKWFKKGSDELNNVMDYLYGNKQFAHSGTRTRILNLAAKNNKVIINIETSHTADAADFVGWPRGTYWTKGKEPKLKHLPMDKWIDTSDNTMIHDVSTNGKKLEEQVLLYLTKMAAQDKTFSGFTGVKLVITVDHPSSNLADLNGQRHSFAINSVNKLNQILDALGWIPVTEIIFVKQLFDPNDKLVHYIKDPNGGYNLVKKV